MFGRDLGEVHISDMIAARERIRKGRTFYAANYDGDSQPAAWGKRYI